MVAKSFSAKKPTKPKFLVKMEERKQHLETLKKERLSVVQVRKERHEEETKIHQLEDEVKYLRGVIRGELENLSRLNPSHPALLSTTDQMSFKKITLRDAFNYQFIYRCDAFDGFDEEWYKRGTHTIRFSLHEAKTDQQYAVGYALTEDVLLDWRSREYFLQDVVRWLNRDIEKMYKRLY